MSKITVHADKMMSLYLPSLKYETMPYDFRGLGHTFIIPYSEYLRFLQDFVVPKGISLFYDSPLYESLLQSGAEYLKRCFLLDTALAQLKELYFITHSNTYNRINISGLGTPKLVNQPISGDEAVSARGLLQDRFNSINTNTRLYIADYKSYPALSYITQLAVTAIGGLQLYDFQCG